MQLHSKQHASATWQQLPHLPWFTAQDEGPATAARASRAVAAATAAAESARPLTTRRPAAATSWTSARAPATPICHRSPAAAGTALIPCFAAAAAAPRLRQVSSPTCLAYAGALLPKSAAHGAAACALCRAAAPATAPCCWTIPEAWHARAAMVPADSRPEAGSYDARRPAASTASSASRASSAPGETPRMRRRAAAGRIAAAAGCVACFGALAGEAAWRWVAGGRGLSAVSEAAGAAAGSSPAAARTEQTGYTQITEQPERYSTRATSFHPPLDNNQMPR